MKIRALTGFLNIMTGQTGGPSAPDGSLAEMARFLRSAERAFVDAGIEVQTLRVATQPFPAYGLAAAELPAFVRRLRTACDELGIAYLAIGPVGADDDLAYRGVLADVLSTGDVFASVMIARPDSEVGRGSGIDLGLLRGTAGLIQQLSRLTPDGMRNLYLCASANVRPGGPFFPSAYHDGGPARFALAIQAADIATEAFAGAASPADACTRLTERIDAAAARLVPVAERLAAAHKIDFGGLDFSLAPYPGAETSLGGAMENLGVRAGGGGMLAAAALTMNAIEASMAPRCGFSGLMLPVLEDSTLAARAAEGVLTVNDLLLYSAVCGTGLDCIPLPGDVDEAALTGILLDTAALALRLDKPLTARLMPMPGKAAGDPLTFEFEYFAPSRVMQSPAGLARVLNVGAAFSGDATFCVAPRRRA